MTVRELCSWLQTFEPDLEVYSREEAWLIDVSRPERVWVGEQHNATVNSADVRGRVANGREAVLL